jgi:site-specific recombinase XerD
MQPEEAELAKRYLAYLEAQGKSLRLRFKRSWQLRKISDLLGKHFKDATKDDLEELARKIRQATAKRGKPISEPYKFDLFLTTRTFYKWLLGEGKRYPGILDNFYMAKPHPALLHPSKLISEEEVKRIIDQTASLQEKAFISLLYATGARIGEMLNLKVSDVFKEGNETLVRLDGKTGERIVPVGWPLALEFMQVYLDVHPRKFEKNSNVPLWLNGWGKQLSYAAACNTIARLQKLAGINKKLNPHSWRHARASEMAKHLTDQQLKYYFGWRPDSDMTARYVHADRYLVQEKFEELYGKNDPTRIDADLATIIHAMAVYLQDGSNKKHFQQELMRRGAWSGFQQSMRSLKLLLPSEK